MSAKKFLYNSLITTLGLFEFLFSICLSSQVEEIRYPVPSYEGKALEKVRLWEDHATRIKGQGVGATSGDTSTLEDD
jgi:hypothetical protein